jgi:hypothetical protein
MLSGEQIRALTDSIKSLPTDQAGPQGSQQTRPAV